MEFASELSSKFKGWQMKQKETPASFYVVQATICFVVRSLLLNKL
jgi:hypothetical protein